MPTPEERRLEEEKQAVQEQNQQKAQNIAIAKGRSLALNTTPYAERPETIQTEAIRQEIVEHIGDSLKEMADIIARKGSAKEMATALRPAAMLNLAKDMMSHDTKTSQAASLQILDRSDGKSKGDGDDKPPVTVNILNVTNEELARRTAFMERLKEEKNVQN